MGVALAGTGASYLLLTVGVILVASFLEVSWRWLEDLDLCFIPTEDLTEAKEQPKPLKNRKGKKKGPDVSSFVAGATQIAMMPFPKHRFLHIRYFQLFDQLVMCIAFVTANAVVWEVASGAFGVPHENGTITMLTLLLLAAALRAVITPELDPNTTPAGERMLCYMTAGLGGFICLLFVTFTPVSVVDFGVEPAAATFGPNLMAWLTANSKGRFEVPGDPHYFDIHPLQIKLLMTLIATLLSGVALAPAVRVLRSYNLSTSPPAWGEDHLQTGVWARALMHANVFAPLLVLFMWSPVLSPREALGVSEGAWESAARPAMLCVAGGLQVLLVRPYIQAFLNTALVQWYELKHNSTDGIDGARVGVIIQKKVLLVRELSLKVATQVLAPACILVACGVLLRAKSPAAVAAVAGAGGGGLIAPEMWRVLGGFVAWWWCAVWFTISAVFVTGLKTGAFSNSV